MIEERTKLAEAMGWKDVRMRLKCGGHQWLSWLGPEESIFSRIAIPDPFTDANDCEALIQHLNSLGWQVEIHWQHTSDENLAAGSWIHIWQHGTEIHHRADIDVDRWKLLVCNIALAIFTPVHDGHRNND